VNGNKEDSVVFSSKCLLYKVKCEYENAAANAKPPVTMYDLSLCVGKSTYIM